MWRQALRGPRDMLCRVAVLAVEICRLCSWLVLRCLAATGRLCTGFLLCPCAETGREIQAGLLPHRLSPLCPGGESSVESSRSFSNTNKPSPGVAMMLEMRMGVSLRMQDFPRVRSQPPPSGMQDNLRPERWRRPLKIRFGDSVRIMALIHRSSTVLCRPLYVCGSCWER